MSSPLKSSTPPQRLAPALPLWQRERAALVHHLCILLAARKAGVPLYRKSAQLIRPWNGRPYKCDPERTVQLSAKSLRRLFYEWKHGGELPAAVRLHYTCGKGSKLDAALVRRFLTICFEPGVSSCRKAYRILDQRRWSHSKGRSRPLASFVSYATLLRHLPAGLHRAIRQHRAAIAKAELAFAQFRIRAEADALATIPPVTAKVRRVTPAPTFDI